MNTKTLILIFVAMLCIQLELSSGASDKKPGRVKRRVVLKSPSGKSTSKSSLVESAKVKDKAITSDNDDTDPNTTIIKGEKGVIKIDGKVVKNDKDFKKGVMRLSISAGCIYINNNLILKRKISSPIIFGESTMNDNGITKFEIRVMKNGQVLYTDNRGSIMNAHL